MEIRYDKAAAKYLKKLPQKTRESIREAIKGLVLNPPKGDIKPMQGYKGWKESVKSWKIPRDLSVYKRR